MDINAAAGGKGKRAGGGVMNVNQTQGNPSSKATTKVGQRAQTRPPFDKNKCLNCGGVGHWRDACPSPKKKGTGGGGGSVMNVEVEGEDPNTEDDDDDAEAFVNCTELGGAGNDPGQAEAPPLT